MGGREPKLLRRGTRGGGSEFREGNLKAVLACSCIRGWKVVGLSGAVESVGGSGQQVNGVLHMANEH